MAWDDTRLVWNDTINSLACKDCGLDLFMVTKSHFQSWLLGSKKIANKLPHFHIFYQPLKKGHHNFWTSRPLEPFLVDLMQRGFCEKTLYSYLAWCPWNPFLNWSILLKIREFPEAVIKFHKAKLDWPCSCVVDFEVLLIAQFGRIWLKIGMQLGFDKMFAPSKYHASFWTMEVTTASVSFQTPGLYHLCYLKP